MAQSPTAPAAFRLKFLADPAFASELRAAAASDPATITIESETNEQGGTRLGFNLETVLGIVAVIKGAVDLRELSKKVVDWFKRSNTNVVVLQTPFAKLELRKTHGVTEDDVRKFLEAATKLTT